MISSRQSPGNGKPGRTLLLIYTSGLMHQMVHVPQLSHTTSPLAKVWITGKNEGQNIFQLQKHVLKADPLLRRSMSKFLFQCRPQPRLSFQITHLFSEWTSVTTPLETRTVHKKLLRFVDLYPKDIPTHVCVWHKLEVCWENFCLLRSHLKKRECNLTPISWHQTNTRQAFWKAFLSTCYKQTLLTPKHFQNTKATLFSQLRFSKSHNLRSKL